MRNAPDRAVTVFGDQERAVARDRDADRAAPALIAELQTQKATLHPEQK